MTAVAISRPFTNVPRRRWRWPIIMAGVAGLLWIGFLQLCRLTLAEGVRGTGIEARIDFGTCGEWRVTPLQVNYGPGTVVRWRECEAQLMFHTAHFMHVEYEEPRHRRYEDIQVDIRWWPGLIACAGIMLAATLAVILMGELWRWLFG